MPNKQDDYAARYAADLVNRTSIPNRNTVRAYWRLKKGQGVRITTFRWTAAALYNVDRIIEGKPFDQITPEQMSVILADYASTRSPNTVRVFCAHMRAFLKWVHHTHQLSYDMTNALTRAPTAPLPAEEPLSERERDLLVTAAETKMPRRRSALLVALVWMLWDTGFRISELCSLRIRDVSFRDENQTARVALDPNEPNLKTGARVIFIKEAVPALKAYLALHPNASDPTAYLLTSLRGTDSLQPNMAPCILQRLAADAGIARTRKVHPHLFRHTRATRAARLPPIGHGWKEAQLRAFFGWGPGSTMPAHYVHLAEADIESDVRAAAAQATIAKTADPASELADALKSLSSTLKHLGKRVEPDD